MANQNFDASLKYVLVDEGGNDDDPQDHGGRTSRGITQREYDSWCQLNGKASGDVWKAPQAEISAVYNSQYWNPYCDSLPSGVDYVFFDTCVNAGRAQAVKSFQRALNLPVDGMLGNQTLGAILSTDPAQLIHDVSDVRRNFYRNLAQFPRYGKGWLGRVNHCENGALAMVKANVTPVSPSMYRSPKANPKDVAKTTVSPETSSTTAAASGGVIAILNQFRDDLSPYLSDLKIVGYILVGVAVIGLGYSMYGYWHRSKVQAAT